MRFEKYERPTSVEECIQLLCQYKADARLLAGGTDLIPRLRAETLSVKAVIDMAHIPELRETEETDGYLFLGCMQRLADIQKKSRFSQPYAVLSSCAGHVSSMQIRNVATLGGNTCNASPGADTVPGLLVLDAECCIRGREGRRYTDLADFFLAPGTTALREGELLEGFQIPTASPHTGAAYEKYSIRGDSDISIVGAGASLTLDARKRIRRARIALAAVAPTPLRVREAEECLTGEIFSRDLLEKVISICERTCEPISDQRASASYRREMVSVFTRKALCRAFELAEASFDDSPKASSLNN